ncbi:Tn3 family transposase [Streptosporangium sp. NPDC000509]|uniref:Tn3 family transposase n=1 Tax=Streptosporangium sp. NPDC000509 TaxID=3366186 RepID=UPI0036C6D6C2
MIAGDGTEQGTDGDLAGADKESQEVSMLALHLLQSALVHVNTLLMQQVLADEKWAAMLTNADRRALPCPRCSERRDLQRNRLSAPVPLQAHPPFFSHALQACPASARPTVQSTPFPNGDIGQIRHINQVVETVLTADRFTRILSGVSEDETRRRHALKG